MRCGALVRITDRGLGVQMRAFAQNIDCSPLVIRNPDDARLGLDEHPEWFPGAPTVTWADGHLEPEDLVRDYIRDLDVLFSAETMYQWEIVEWCRDAGVATVVQANPEFYRHGLDETLPHPTQWVTPTGWLARRIPDNLVLPVPCPDYVERRAPREGPLRAVHVVGHQAAGDRNGTLPVAYSLPMVRRPTVLTVSCQDRIRPAVISTGNVQVRQLGHVNESADLYAGQELLLIPRRYGGLCIPVLEAAASGLAVAMTGASPQTSMGWPIVPIESAVFRDGHRAPGGMVPVANATAEGVAAALNRCADPEFLATAQTASERWARANTWERWRPEYLRVLEAACERATVR